MTAAARNRHKSAPLLQPHREGDTSRQDEPRPSSMADVSIFITRNNGPTQCCRATCAQSIYLLTLCVAGGLFGYHHCMCAARYSRHLSVLLTNSHPLHNRWLRMRRTTSSANGQLRPGGHDTLPAKPIDVSAFSYSKRTAHQSPLSFLKRGTGNGGTVISHGSGHDPSSSREATKGAGATRAAARSAAVVKKTKLRDFQVKAHTLQHQGTYFGCI